MVKQILPDRKATSVKRRWEYIEINCREQVTAFISVFERKYTEALERGEVQPIVEGYDFDLKKWMDWYDDNGFAADETKGLPPYSPNINIR